MNQSPAPVAQAEPTEALKRRQRIEQRLAWLAMDPSANSINISEFIADVRAALSSTPAESVNAQLLKACKQALYALKGREHDGFLRDAIARAEATPVAPAVLLTDERTGAVYQFEVWLGFDFCASGEAPTVEAMRAEASRYAAQYAQDGEISVREFVRYPLEAVRKSASASPTACSVASLPEPDVSALRVPPAGADEVRRGLMAAAREDVLSDASRIVIGRAIAMLGGKQ